MDKPTIEQACKLADQDCPLPSLAGPALKVLRERVRELESWQAARVDEEDMRKSFEEWVGITECARDPLFGGSYMEDRVDAQWLAWQAALAQNTPNGEIQAKKERDFLVEEYERAIGCGSQGYSHAAMHLFNAITNAQIDAKSLHAERARVPEGMVAVRIGMLRHWLCEFNILRNGHDPQERATRVHASITAVLAAAPSQPAQDAEVGQ